MTQKTVLITGCSSGFGKLAARTFHAHGWNVAATMRRPELENELTELEGMLVTRLDVTSQASIEAARLTAETRFGAIDVVVNNAGYGGLALFELMDEAAIREMYETNVFGLMNLTRAVLPSMRRRGEGRVINVTSMAGAFGFPMVAPYVSTKHAVEGLTEALALEYRSLNIRFHSVMPGAYPTTRFMENIAGASATGDAQLASHSAELAQHLQGVTEAMSTQGGAPSDPQEVADMILRCATEEMPVHNPVGADALQLAERMTQVSRESFLDELAGMVLPPQSSHA